MWVECKSEQQAEKKYVVVVSSCRGNEDWITKQIHEEWLIWEGKLGKLSLADWEPEKKVRKAMYGVGYTWDKNKDGLQG